MVAVCAGLGSAFLWRGNAVVPASTFILLDATNRTASDLKGRVTPVNFGATSCLTCIAEMPELMENRREERDSDIRIAWPQPELGLGEVSIYYFNHLTEENCRKVVL